MNAGKALEVVAANLGVDPAVLVGLSPVELWAVWSRPPVRVRVGRKS